jgi:outer membrane protein assembly factor BamB
VYVGSAYPGKNIYALKASTGALLWSYATVGDVGSSPAVANGVVYVGLGYPDNSLYALNASTGAKLWKYTTGSGVESSPAVANGVVYVGSDDSKVYAFSLRHRPEQAEAASKRPDLRMLRPGLNLKVSKPVATPSGAEL